MEILINFMVLVLIPWLVLQSEYSSLQTQKLDCNQWQVSVLCKAGAQQEKTRIRNVKKKPVPRPFCDGNPSFSEHNMDF